jgi:hypothetical protein
MAQIPFKFEPKGIGELISGSRLFVPLNQRSYAWEDRNITELLQDINAAVYNADSDYFLGTIVLVQEDEKTPLIADGQQRIATASIILARIRDIFYSINRDQRAKGIDDTYLRKIDLETEVTVPQLQLNINDNEYFRANILISPKEITPLPPVPAAFRSNRLLRRASAEIDKFFRTTLTTMGPTHGPEYLLKWVNFLRNKVSIVLVTVPDELGAFRIFETLNDRGLRASQSDILKNYFLSRAGTRLTEAHGLWNGVAGALNTIAGDKDDHIIKYFRNLWITDFGPTREKEVADIIKKEIVGELKTMQFLSKMTTSVTDYVAVWSPSHEKWTEYKNSTRKYLITIIDHLKVEQIRPLLFAVAMHFTTDEADKAYKLFVSWSVRFLIAGGGRGGTLDKHYGDLAKAVGTKVITKARELRDAMKDIVPGDSEFATAFATATVGKTYLRRYYLRALDKTLKGEPEPEYVANEDESQINLEHVLPVTPGEDWDINEDVAEATENMLGNMVLMKAKKNADLGNKAFAEKKAAYAGSSYLITNQVSEYDKWGIEEIKDRQSKMAEIAKKTWSLDFK